jgi:hypothetical protein
VINQTRLAAYGTGATAVQAVNAGANGYGNVIYSPQIAGFLPSTGPNSSAADHLTADPLLRSSTPVISTEWLDLPDMSTPLYATIGTDNEPLVQAAALSDPITGLGKNRVVNDWIFGDTPLPMDTDWVVSQPTRRYFAALAYGVSDATSFLVWNEQVLVGTTSSTSTAPVILPPTLANNRYATLRTQVRGDLGIFSCIPANLGATDREETNGPVASPAPNSNLCGEVFTLSFGRDSRVMNGRVANYTVTGLPRSGMGWGVLTLGGATALNLPLVGFSATSAQNVASGGNFGLTMPHRW